MLLCEYNKLHREEDLPVIIYSNRVYYRENDKPAVEYADGPKIWYKNGRFLRFSC